MADETVRQQISRRLGELKQERNSFIPHWRELTDFLSPRTGKYLIIDRNKGVKANDKIINSCATTSLRTLKSGMHAGMTSPARPWFRLTSDDVDLMKNGSVKQWLFDVENRMRVVFARSNFYNVMPQMYGCAGGHGTAAMMIVGLKVADTMADIVTAASGAMQRLEVANMVRGSFEYLRDPAAVHLFASEASGAMRHLDHEIGCTMTVAPDEMAGRETVLDDVQRWVMESRLGVARVAAMMAWISGYREAQAKGLDGMEAVSYADTGLPVIWNAGRGGDLPVAEITSKTRELAKLMGPAILRYNNLASNSHRVADQGTIETNPTNGAKAILFVIAATGILKECLKDSLPEAADPFLPWFLARLGQGLFDDIPSLDELAGHGEGRITRKTFDRPALEAGKATLGAVGGKGDQATITGHFFHDLLSGEYDPGSPWSPATDILSLGRYQQ